MASYKTLLVIKFSEMSQKINLNDLCIDKSDRPGWSKAFGGLCAEAASVCLEKQGHINSSTLHIDGDYSHKFEISWSEVTDEMHRFQNDDQVAIEFGAYGISALIIPKLTNLTIIERSKKGTGFDFWLGSIDDPAPLFQKKARLEVSGIGNGTEKDIKSRVNTKLKQITPSDGSLPGYVSIVEFSAPCSRVVKKCKK